MSKHTRQFEIIQIIRGASRAILARDLAESLQVSVRTIYRDILSLQQANIPIHGAPGVGYVIDRAYNLPPINLDHDEADALFVGLNLVSRTGDADLWEAARRAMRKLNSVASENRCLVTSSWGAELPPNVSVSEIREAIRVQCKVYIEYRDQNLEVTKRMIWPVAIIYYVSSVVLVSWCELRQSIRHFRLNRLISYSISKETFDDSIQSILTDWENDKKDYSVQTRIL